MSDIDTQLRLLIDQYGVAAVRGRLNAIARPPRKPSVRKNAHQYVGEMDLPNAVKERLLTLAQLFDEKRFLPTAADVKNFCEAYGTAQPNSKNRQQAVPHIFRFLSSFSDERLSRIINEGLFSGPSELGPIADAIKERGGSLRREDDAANASGQTETDLEPKVNHEGSKSTPGDTDKT